MFTILDYSSALEYSIIRRYTNIVYYYVVIWMACKRTNNQYETSCGFRSHPRECPYASGSISSLSIWLDNQYQYIHNSSVNAHNPLQIIKTLTATGWGKQKETLMFTNKAVMRLFHPRPALTNCIVNCHRMHTRHKHTTSA